MTEARRLVVLRHGETTHNADGVWQGQLDSPLSDRGRRQALAVASVLSRYSPVRVVASDLSRAADTGRAVAAACAIPVTYDARFREIHAGSWQGMSGADVRASFPEDAERMLRGEDFKRGGDGESVAEVAARVVEGATEVLAALSPSQCAVIATHGVAGRALVAELLGLGQQRAWLMLEGLGNCRWAEVVEGRAGWRLAAWNLRAGDLGAVETDG